MFKPFEKLMYQALSIWMLLLCIAIVARLVWELVKPFAWLLVVLGILVPLGRLAWERWRW